MQHVSVPHTCFRVDVSILTISTCISPDQVKRFNVYSITHIDHTRVHERYSMDYIKRYPGDNTSYNTYINTKFP